MIFLRRSLLSLLALFALAPASFGPAQSSSNLTQTVNKRNTLGVLTASPTSGLTTGSTVTFSYTLDTAGAPAPTSETVQFMDGSTAIGSAQAIGSEAGSNLLPYSQISPANGWQATGTAPTITSNLVNGPDGSSNTASQVAFPDSTSASTGITRPVPGTAYAGLPLTFSVWAQAPSPTTLTLGLTDSPAVSASKSASCLLTSSWQRCTLTYTFPAGAGTGFAVTLSLDGQAAQTVQLWGAQVEQASAAGPYVSTIGVARPTGGQGGFITFPYSQLHNGTHTVTAVYAGDANFVASISNVLTLNFSSATPTIALAASPATGAVYGQTVTLTATLAPPVGSGAETPTGTVQFFDGTTLLGSTTTNSSGIATLVLAGLGSLPAGTHSLTAVYSGNSDFSGVTSSVLAYTVAQASNSVTVSVSSSLNPSTYGDDVTISFLVVSAIGAAIPTGTVTVMDGTTNLGTVTLDDTGAGSLTVPSFTAGTHTITVTYSGDGNYD